MTRILSLIEISMQSKLQCEAVASWISPAEYGGMSKRGPYGRAEKPPVPPHRRNNLRNWRKFRGLTQPELSEKSGVSGGMISSIENGDAGYSDESLYNLATALKTTPGMIIDVNPYADPELWALVLRADTAERAQITKHAEVIVADKPTKPIKPRK